MALQRQANTQAEAAYTRSSLQSLSYEQAVGDAHDALVGIMHDLSGASDRTSLWDILTYKDRMRGLGFLLVALAMVGLVADYVLHPST